MKDFERRFKQFQAGFRRLLCVPCGVPGNFRGLHRGSGEIQWVSESFQNVSVAFYGFQKDLKTFQHDSVGFRKVKGYLF